MIPLLPYALRVSSLPVSIQLIGDKRAIAERRQVFLAFHSEIYGNFNDLSGSAPVEIVFELLVGLGAYESEVRWGSRGGTRAFRYQEHEKLLLYMLPDSKVLHQVIILGGYQNPLLALFSIRSNRLTAEKMLVVQFYHLISTQC